MAADSPEQTPRPHAPAGAPDKDLPAKQRYRAGA